MIKAPSRRPGGQSVCGRHGCVTADRTPSLGEHTLRELALGELACPEAQGKESTTSDQRHLYRR